jgi:dTDP-4-dehydrorhamnose 3,5-epimerase-like enzyme
MSLRATQIHTLRDARGALFEPLDAEGLADKRNVHVVITAPGTVRGNHRHLAGTEVAVLVGPALARFKENGQIRDFEVPGGETWQFVIPPGVVHAYKNPGPEPLVIVAFNTLPHDPTNANTVREEILA